MQHDEENQYTNSKTSYDNNLHRSVVNEVCLWMFRKSSTFLQDRTLDTYSREMKEDQH